MYPKLIPHTQLHIGLIIAVLAMILLFIVMHYTTIGQKVRIVGKNALAARHAGIRSDQVFLLTFFISGALAGLAGAWVKAVLTDQARPLAPMERLREKWPHTIALDFAPEGGLTGAEADLVRLAEASDPAEICGLFVEFVAGAPPDEAQRAVLADAVAAAQHGEVAA